MIACDFMWWSAIQALTGQVIDCKLFINDDLSWLEMVAGDELKQGSRWLRRIEFFISNSLTAIFLVCSTNKPKENCH